MVAEVFARLTSENALKRDTPAAHPRVGFVCMDPEQAVSVLGAVAARLRSHGSDAKWTLPKHGAHFRTAGIETRGKVAALFSGQGSQYTHMFDDAAMNWPQVRAAVAAMDAQSVEARPQGTPLVSEVLYPRAAYESESDPKYDERLQNTLHAQPATVAVSVGAFDIMKSAGLHADFAAGHSNMVKVPALAVPQLAPMCLLRARLAALGQLGTPRARPSHWAPRHRITLGGLTRAALLSKGRLPIPPRVSILVRVRVRVRVRVS